MTKDELLERLATIAEALGRATEAEEDIALIIDEIIRDDYLNPAPNNTLLRQQLKLAIEALEKAEKGGTPCPSMKPSTTSAWHAQS